MTGFFKECLARRVPQYVGAYLVLIWGVVQFVSFIEERYRLTGPLVEVVAGLLLLLLPTVLVYAWSQGRPGRDRWTRPQLASILGNAIVAGLVLFVAFRGQDISAATRTIRVVDENGKQTEREVPRRESVQRMAFFPFQVDPAADEDMWLGWAMAGLLTMDSYQNLFIELRPPAYLTDLFRNDGFGIGRDIPRAKLLDTAREQHCEWFVHGRITRTDTNYRVLTELVSVKTGRVESSQEATYATPFESIDQIARKLWEDSGVPGWYLEELVDLPVREMYSEDDVALKDYFLAEIDMVVLQDLPAAAQRLDRTVERDPSFSMAQILRFAVHSYLQNSDVSNAALQAAMEHEYRLPERIRFSMRATHYLNIEKDPERALAVAEMWSQLYPNDLEALRVLAQLHNLRGETDELVQILERTLEVTPDRPDILDQLGRVRMSQGDLAGAEIAFRRYAELNPADWRSRLQIGDLYVRQSRFEDARMEFENAALLEPRNVDLQLRAASVEERLGRFEEARAARESALAFARSANDSLTVYDRLGDAEQLLGRYERSLRIREQWLELAERSYNPTQLAAERIQSGHLYLESGRIKEARAMLDHVGRLLDPASRVLLDLGEAWFLIELGDWDAADEKRASIESFGKELSLAPYVYQAGIIEGTIAQKKGEHARAAELFESLDRDRPGDRGVLRRWGRALVDSGQPREALTPLETCRDLHPYDPETHLELGRAHLALDDGVKARAHLEAALDIWKEADPGHGKKSEAEQLLDSLKSS